jgi:hypothetical protein
MLPGRFAEDSFHLSAADLSRECRRILFPWRLRATRQYREGSRRVCWLHARPHPLRVPAAGRVRRLNGLDNRKRRFGWIARPISVPLCHGFDGAARRIRIIPDRILHGSFFDLACSTSARFPKE